MENDKKEKVEAVVSNEEFVIKEEPLSLYEKLKLNNPNLGEGCTEMDNFI
tara:strand:- start:6687 stop:6836 length:150 start_codon:yes stop_codon:yes gene_type:complete